MIVQFTGQDLKIFVEQGKTNFTDFESIFNPAYPPRRIGQPICTPSLFLNV